MKNMRAILTVILSLLVLSSFSQTIKEREKDLDTFMPGTTWKTKTGKAWELLSIDKFNETAIRYILRVYNADFKRDSIDVFFKNLINNNKESITPYLLRIKFSRLEGLTDKKRIEYLTRAYQLDSSNIQIDSLLGRLCYEEFNNHFSSNLKRNNEIDYYAKTSLTCFNRLCELDKRFQANLKFPLIQLSSYLNDSINKEKYNKYRQEFYYFPVTKFLNLPPDWETNEKIDVIDNPAFFKLEWYSKHLAALNEPILFNSDSAKIFRFTWLRTFHNPVVISLRNEKDKITLYWKVCDGMGGYDPGFIIINQSKELPLREWNDFANKINGINFWSESTRGSEISGTDGSIWILEGKDTEKYQFIDSWNGMGIREICLTLLKLTDLKIKEDEIY